MSDYDQYIPTGNVVLHPEYLGEIMGAAAAESVVLSLGRRLRNMTARELKIKVQTEMPTVSFVGEKGLTQTFPADATKKTTDAKWEDVSLYAGELACTIWIPNNVLADADFSIEAELRRNLPTAIAQKIDAAVLFGTTGVDVPDDWSSGVFTAMPAENKVDSTLGADLYDAILGEGGLFAQVEADGYDVNGVVSSVKEKAALRGLRDVTSGQPIFQQTMQGGPVYTLAGVPMTFPKNGGFDASKALMIAGQWDKLVYSIRQDITVDKSTVAVQTDGSGNVTHNAWDEDMTAFRVTFRMAWGMPLASGYDVTVSGTAYPFSALVP